MLARVLDRASGESSQAATGAPRAQPGRGCGARGVRAEPAGRIAGRMMFAMAGGSPVRFSGGSKSLANCQFLIAVAPLHLMASGFTHAG